MVVWQCLLKRRLYANLEEEYSYRFLSIVMEDQKCKGANNNNNNKKLLYCVLKLFIVFQLTFIKGYDERQLSLTCKRSWLVEILSNFNPVMILITTILKVP